jgi:hypothetical protein
MNPFKIFLFGCGVVALIALVSLVFPPRGIKIGEQTLTFPDFRTWAQAEEQAHPYKDISNITTSVSIDEDPEPSSDTLPTRRIMPVDSMYSSYTYPFEFPEGEDTLMYPFFRVAKTAAKRNKPVRILHYGDSQIENDRITSTIRNYMQHNYGGQGCGFIPIVSINDASRIFNQDIAPEWMRTSVLDRQRDTLDGGRFGIAGSLSRYTGADTVAHIGLGPINFGYRKARVFTHVRLFYGHTDAHFSAVINQTDTQQLSANDIVSSAWWRFGKPQASIRITLRSKTFPDIYGIALDGAAGVATDNIPMRGSTGLDFMLMDTKQMQHMFRMMDVKALILQFGANIVPDISAENAEWYAERLTQQLNSLKILAPELLVIVIGTGDMSQSTPNGYISHDGVSRVRNLQKKAAFATGCVFWDLLETMGGENSMPGWVFENPPLAQKDFTHFTVRGAKIIGELFCRAWTKEYVKFEQKNQ